MTDIDDEDRDDYTDDDDWYDDRDDYREPDPEDAEIARSYEEYYEHCERKHGGGECDCRPSRLLLAREAASRRIWHARHWLRYLPRNLQAPRTVRIGPAEITLRLRPRRDCGACGGEGWWYSKTGISPRPMPEGYDGVALCGCGAAIGKLAEARRIIRQAQHEPPF